MEYITEDGNGNSNRNGGGSNAVTVSRTRRTVSRTHAIPCAFLFLLQGQFTNGNSACPYHATESVITAVCKHREQISTNTITTPYGAPTWLVALCRP